MTCHPLSVRSQLLLHFEKVANVRFEVDATTTTFRILLSDGRSGHDDKELYDYLMEHQPMVALVELGPWVDGPAWPSMYDRFTSVQRQLIECCDGTRTSIETTVVQAFECVHSASCTSPVPGSIRVTVRGRHPLTASDLAAIKEFLVACDAEPRLAVEVVEGDVVATPNDPYPLPFMDHQASRDGVLDPYAFAVAVEDEDYFRDARVGGFRGVVGLQPGNVAGARAVFLPRQFEHFDISSFIPLYDVAYAPVEPNRLNDEMLYGLTRQDRQALLTSGRLVHVFTHRLGEYPQKQLREVLETGHFVAPRRLAAASASQMLSANPMWRVAAEDVRLAKAQLDEFSALVRAERDADNDDVELAESWASFTRDGCLHFLLSAMSQGALAPVSFGAGALIAAFVRRRVGDKGRDVELRLLGLDVSHAMALGATLVPEPFPQLYPLYEALTVFSGARAPDHQNKVLESLPFVAQLDVLLNDLHLRRPAGMPISEWLNIATPMVGQLRSLLAELFAGKGATVDGVRRVATEVQKNLDKLARGNESTAKSVDRFEIVGLTADALAWGMGASFPFAGTAIGALLRRGFPRAWEALGRSEIGMRGRDVLEGLNAFVPPNIVRLHRMQRQLAQRASSWSSSS